MHGSVKRPKADSKPLAVADVSRKPQQGRSLASLKRMLEAARDLMLERGNEEFTLQEVSDHGQVSIGSIYLRFESKDNLVRGVIAEALEALAEEEAVLFQHLSESCADLEGFMVAYVESYAEVLRKHAPLLRLTMERAQSDPLVAMPGKQQALRSETDMTEALLGYAGEFGSSNGEDHRIKAQSCYHVIFATLARQLSLGTSGAAVHDFDWTQMKRELASMCIAYLRAA